MNIQELTRQHYNRWIEANQFVIPTLADTLDFMMTEVAEAIDIRLRISPAGYVRNNPSQENVDNLAIEIFDAIMMGCIALDILGVDLEDVARAKLSKMDKKRGIE